MSDTNLKLTIEAETGQAVEGVDKLDKKLDETGKSAQEAGDKGEALGKIGEGAKASAEDMVKLEEASNELIGAFAGLDGSTASIDRAQKALDQMRAATEKAGVASKDMVGQLAGAQARLDEISSGTAKLNAALAKLDTTSPGRLSRAATEAQLALDAEREAAEKAGTVTAEMGQRFDEAQKKIDAASVAGRKFADTAGDMRTRGDLAAKGFESMASGAGSFEGMLGKLKDTGSATQQKMADAGFAIVSLGASFAAGYAAGEKLDGGLKAIGLDLSRLGEGSKGVVGMFSDFGLAMSKILPIGEANKKILKDLHDATSAYSDVLGPLPTKINPILAALHAHQRAASDAADGAKKYGVVLVEAGNQATELSNKTKLIEDFFKAHEKGKGGVMDLDKAIQANAPTLLAYRDAWLASGKAIGEMDPVMRKWIEQAEKVDEAQKRSVEAMKAAKQASQDILDAEAKKKLAADDEIKRLNELADRVAHGTAKEDELAAAIAKVAEQHKTSVAVIQNAMKGYEQSAVEVGKYVDALGKLADRVNMHRASNADLEKEIEKTAKATGKSTEEIRRLVAAKADEIQAFKDSQPVYKNAAEANEQYAGTIKDLIKEIEDLAAAKKKEADAMYAAAAAENEAREKKGGGPADYLKDLDAIKEKTADVRRETEGLGQAWVTAREYVTSYLGEARKASEESTKLNESQTGLLDNLSKFAEQNKQTTEWFQTFIGEMEKAMKNAGTSYEAQSKVLDDFLTKLGSTTNWMQNMNAEFNPEMYGDVARQFGTMADMIQRFKEQLGAPGHG